MIRRPIRQLPSHIASLIAAGEVIRRPEDIVRELIDNSVDAGATQIDINITQGGLEKIQIKDNGIGIAQNELKLALMHHATSKINHIEDLEQLQTLGFRGEALASITAVSRVELSSRTPGSEHGFIIRSKPDQALPDTKPIAHSVGTTITITELFHQIPARRRFLRAAATEFARIHSWIKYLSLSHATINFSLQHNNRNILKCTLPQNIDNPRLPRLANLYSADFVKSAIFIEEKGAAFTLMGWISPPDFSRSQPDWQCFYINHRLIKDKSLSHAVKKAYHDVLYRDRHAAVILFLTLDAKEVDVNVHPTKAEVRFHQPQSIYSFVYRSIQNALLQNKQWLPNTAATYIPPESHTQTSNIPVPYQTNFSSQALQFENQRFEKIDLISQNILPVQSSHSTQRLASSDTIQKHLKHTHLEETTDTIEPLGYALSQLHGTYILAQNDKGLVVVDAHAAHERILYEKLKASFEKEKTQVQQLLIPLTFSLTPAEIHLTKSHYALFQKLGFEYTENEADKLTIKAIPHVLSHIPSEPLIRDLLTDLKEHGLSLRLEEKRNQLLSTIACRSATQANRTMSVYEMNQLLRFMETTPHSGQCNHGRPTWRQITLSELDSWFLRGR